AHDSRNPQIDKEFAKEGRCKGRFAYAGSGCENDESLKGLTMGSLKISGSKKGMMMSKRAVTTPGSGESLLRGQMLNEIIVALNQEEKDKTPRILFIDFYEKSKDSDVNPSTSDELKGDINSEDYEDVGDEGLDKLCEEMSKITVNKVTAKFTGKHIRFAYNSDGELAGEIEKFSGMWAVGPMIKVMDKWRKKSAKDNYAIQSFERGIAAYDSRAFAWEIAHVKVPGPRGRLSTIVHNNDDLGKAINRNDAIFAKCYIRSSFLLLVVS
ncbi:hypothetical protein Tco_1009199, partial [Tanacetum coccineum]